MFGLNRNHFFGVFLLALLSLGQLQRITTPFFSFYIHDILVLVWLIDLCVTYSNLLFLKTKSLIQRNTFLTAFFLIAVTWILLGWFWQWNTSGFSLWPLAYSVRMFVYGALSYALIQINNTKKILSNHDIGYGLEVFYPILLLFGWLQYFFIKDTRWLATLGWDDHLGRMIGTQFDPNFLGLLLVFASIWTVFQFQQTRNTRYFVTSLLVVAAIIVTWSRATYVTFTVIHTAIIAAQIATTLPLFTKQDKKKIDTKKLSRREITSFLLLLVLILGIVLVPKPDGEGGNLARTSTIQSRIEDSQNSVNDLSTTEVILGKGLFVISEDKYQVTYERPNHAKLPTTLPAFILSSVGYGGIVLLAVAALQMGLKIKQQPRLFRKVLSRYPMFALALLATFIHSLANASFTQPFVLLLLLSFVVLENSVTNDK